MTVGVPAPPFPSESTLEVTDCACSDPSCPRTARLVLVWPDAPWTMNDAHNGRVNRWAMNALIAEWREAFRLMSLGAPKLAWCTIVVDHLVGTMRSIDPVACAPAYKAALDGVRLAGVIDDDDGGHVRRVVFNPPVFDGRDALILTIDGPVA